VRLTVTLKAEASVVDIAGDFPAITTEGAVTVEVAGGLTKGDKIQVQYNNVKVEDASDENVAMWADADYYTTLFEVTETIAGADALEYHEEPEVDDEASVEAAKTARNKMVAFKVQPPTKSMVTVNPDEVDAGGKYSRLTVTYTVQDYVYKANEIDINLPEGWM
jgi:hypothetical protein